MTHAINTLVTSALNAATAYGDSIAKLRTALKGHDVPAVRATLLPYVAGFYGVAVVAKERGEGVTLDTTAKRFEAAKKALTRLANDIVGKTANHTELATLTRAQLALIKQCHAAGITMRMFGQGVAQIK
jgi:hypothetical protein